MMERISYKDLPEQYYQALAQVEKLINTSGVDRKLLYLLRFRVSLMNNCAYCLDMHFKEATHAGETPLRLFSVGAWRETPYYTPKEQAALTFAEVLTKLPDDERSEQIHDELRKYFTTAEIGVLTLAIAQINLWNRITRSFGSVPGNYQVRETVEAN